MSRVPSASAKKGLDSVGKADTLKAMFGTSFKRSTAEPQQFSGFAVATSLAAAFWSLVSFLLMTTAVALAADRIPSRRPPAKADPQLSVEALAQQTRQSVVVISPFDREGREARVGA